MQISIKKQEFRLMKDDSILLILGSRQSIDEKDLIEAAKIGKFRGIVIDTFNHNIIKKNSPLRSLKNVIITPNASRHPLMDDKMAIKTFIYNLRQYIKNNFENMKKYTLITLTLPITLYFIRLFDTKDMNRTS